MAWKSSSAAPVWKSGTTNYETAAGSGFSVTEAPAEVRRGATFGVECVGLEIAPTATLGGHSITVNSFTETSISVTIPASHDAKHATSRTLSITAGGITRSVQVNYLPPVGWSYVNFVNPTNDPAIAAFAQMLDDDDNPVLVEEGDQGVYENTVDAGLESWAVIIDPDNTIAVNSGGSPLQGNSLRAYIITDAGRGSEGSLALEALDIDDTPPFEFTGSGGLVLSGSADYSGPAVAPFEFTGTGGLVFSGSADYSGPAVAPFDFTGSGGLSVGGSADIDTGGVTILPPSGLVVIIDTSDQIIQSADRPLDPYDTEWLVFAWDDRIADATLISSDWVMPTDWNLVRTAQNQEISVRGREFKSVNAALVDVNNAAPGRYVVSNRVHLSDGRQFERSVKIKIREM